MLHAAMALADATRTSSMDFKGMVSDLGSDYVRLPLVHLLPSCYFGAVLTEQTQFP